MTKELFNWIKENKSILQETNKVEIIISTMPRNIITEFLIYIRLNDSLNNSIIWDTESSSKYYQVRAIVSKYNELILERSSTNKLYASFASTETARNYNTWVCFKTLMEYVDFMITLDKRAGSALGEMRPYPITMIPSAGFIDNLKALETRDGKCYVTPAGYAQLNKQNKNTLSYNQSQALLGLLQQYL